MSDSQRAEFAVTEYAHVEDAIERIQREHGSKKQLQSMGRVQRFLEAMNEYGKVIEVFLNCSPFVAYIWVCLENYYTNRGLYPVLLGSDQICSSGCQLME
jgi:hypothetical protein